MSFYRSLLASIAAIAIASPVFADDASSTVQSSLDATPAMQTDTSSTVQSSAEQVTATDVSADNKINLNKASAKELMKVKGINAARARAIVAYRKHHEKDGGFKSVEDLSKVKGFKKLKPETLQSIEAQLIVD